MSCPRRVLDDDPNTMSVCFLHVRRWIAPEEDDGRHPLGNRGTHLLARDRLVLVGRIALVDDEVDPEWPRGSVANLGDQPRDRVWKKGGCPDNPEAAGVGDRRSEIGARSCPHASRKYRVLDSQVPAKGSAKPLGHVRHCRLRRWPQLRAGWPRLARPERKNRQAPPVCLRHPWTPGPIRIRFGRPDATTTWV